MILLLHLLIMKQKCVSKCKKLNTEIKTFLEVEELRMEHKTGIFKKKKKSLMAYYLIYQAMCSFLHSFLIWVVSSICFRFLNSNNYYIFIIY